MASPYHVHPLTFGRGLNLVAAPERMGEGQCRVLQNFRTQGEGRITTRKAPRRFAYLDGQRVVGGIPYSAVAGVAAVVFTFQPAEGLDPAVVNLWTVDGNGTDTLIGPLAGWENVSESVRVHACQLSTIVFITDEDRIHGLALWDPNDFQETGTPLFQPTFAFSDAEPPVPAKAKPSFLIEHLNHVFTFGYGAEDDPDRQEYVRFSYLGLAADDHGLGDAGAVAGAAAGSESLFDIEDTFAALPRGEQIVGASSAPGRLLILSSREAHVVFGRDFESFRIDKIDSERGLVNSRAICEADGAAYWFSPLGLCRYRGGGAVEDITELADGGSVRPLLAEIDFSSVVAAHQFTEQHVRFYYRRKDSTTPGADRALIYDYRAQTLLQDHHRLKGGDRIVVAFHLRPSGLEKPASRPFGLTHVDITARSAVATWGPGDTTPGVRTIVRLDRPDGGLSQVATLEGGASRYQLSGLTPETTYATEIEELRNGHSLGPVRASFTTLADTTVLLPEVRLKNSSYLVNEGQGIGWVLYPIIEITWSPVQPITLHIERSREFLGPYEKIASVKGSTIHRDTDTADTGAYWYRFQAEDDAGNLSALSEPQVIYRSLVQPPPGVGDGLPGDGGDDEGFDDLGNESDDEGEGDL